MAVSDTPLNVTGYVDRWSAHPGEELRFYVSTRAPQFEVQLLGLRGSVEESGSYPPEAIACDVNGRYAGVEQPVYTGSCMQVREIPDREVLILSGYFMPTLIGRSDQTIVSFMTGERSQLVLSINTSGRLTLAAPGASALDTSACSESLTSLSEGHWYQFKLQINRSEGDGSASFCPYEFHPDFEEPDEQRVVLSKLDVSEPTSSLLFACRALETGGEQYRVMDAYNGRLANLVLEGGGPSAANETGARSILARWDFVAKADTECVPDCSGNGLHGTTVNRPTRLVTGPKYAGSTDNPFDAPPEFNAIHFHDDDLSNAGWKESFRFAVPEGLPSGVYAMKLSDGVHEDNIPFFVTPRRGGARSRIGVLIPTLSYQVYANTRLDPSILPEELAPLRPAVGNDPAALYVDQYGMRSCYDCHSDGSGVALASLLRPMPISARPTGLSTFNNSPHQLAADLMLLDWLSLSNLDYEVITDHELHREGVARLSEFNVVLSGTHAEYWTSEMLDGLKSYTDGGGRFMYLSGNGLYWVTALSEDGTVAEIRRDQGTRSWSAAPGESYISLSGCRGGLWRHRGRAPQKYVGVGFTSQGFDRGRPFERTQASYDSRASVFFEGIDDHLIGDFPVKVSAYGAAGYEFDRADPSQGTPEHAIVLASATGFSDCYQLAVEDAPAMAPAYGGSVHSDVRADIVFYETPNGGAVFSTSSIAWCSALTYKGGHNNVARLTLNVLSRFMRDGDLLL